MWSEEEAGCRGNPTLHGGPLWGGVCGVRRASPPVLFSLLPARGGLPTPRLVCPQDMVLANDVWLGWEVTLVQKRNSSQQVCDTPSLCSTGTGHAWVERLLGQGLEGAQADGPQTA